MSQADPIRRNNVTVAGNLKADRTILFSHGFASDQSIWSAITPNFARDYRIVSFDHVGAGKSDPQAFSAARYFNLYRFADDLVEICDWLDMRDVTLIGHSKGAMVGALTAIARPERFGRLVLIGASPRYLNDDGYFGGFTRAAVDEIYQAITNRFDDFVEGFADSFVGPQHPDFRQSFAESLANIPPDRAWTILCAVLLSDHRADVARIRIPTLLIQPRSDRAVPMEVAEFLKSRIDGSQLAIIDNDGHFPHVTAAPAVAATIADWLKEQSKKTRR